MLPQNKLYDPTDQNLTVQKAMGFLIYIILF